MAFRVMADVAVLYEPKPPEIAVPAVNPRVVVVKSVADAVSIFHVESVNSAYCVVPAVIPACGNR